LFAGIVSGYVLIRITQRSIIELRLRLCQEIMAVPLRHVERVGTARLLACLNNDISDIAWVIINLPYFFVNIVIIVTCLCYLGWLSPSIAPWFVACILIGIVTYQMPVLSARRYYKLAREQQDSLFQHFRSLLDGAKELKLNVSKQDAFMSELLMPTVTTLRDLNVRAASIYTSTANWNRLLFFLYVGLILLAIPHFSLAGRGTTAAYVLTILYIMGPLEAIMNSSPNLGRANVALGKIETMGLSLDKFKETDDVSPFLNPRWKELTASKIGYSYSSTDDAHGFHLREIDFTVHPGEVVFIVGGNGSGKTTLGKIAAGLYTPDHGGIWLDGVPVDNTNSHSYRKLFSAVFSDFHLFDRVLGTPGPEVDRCAGEFLKLLELDGKLTIRGGVFSTTNLSQGQRKRLALCAALLEDRSIYLFDEWAADQDPEFREIFYLKIIPALARRGKTVLVITHDDRYFHLADLLLKLECGNMVSTVDKRTRTSTTVSSSIAP
jgi:putative ATP-binding cassette transporter